MFHYSNGWQTDELEFDWKTTKKTFLAELTVYYIFKLWKSYKYRFQSSKIVDSKKFMTYSNWLTSSYDNPTLSCGLIQNSTASCSKQKIAALKRKDLACLSQVNHVHKIKSHFETDRLQNWSIKRMPLGNCKGRFEMSGRLPRNQLSIQRHPNSLQCSNYTSEIYEL